MDGCFETLGGCFLWIFLFAIVYIIIHIFIGIFWIALAGAFVCLLFFGVLKLLADGVVSIFKKRKNE